jgi:hypothetical protein
MVVRLLAAAAVAVAVGLETALQLREEARVF